MRRIYNEEIVEQVRECVPCGPRPIAESAREILEQSEFRCQVATLSRYLTELYRRTGVERWWRGTARFGCWMSHLPLTTPMTGNEAAKLAQNRARTPQQRRLSSRMMRVSSSLSTRSEAT
jgi:hypothetical protein